MRFLPVLLAAFFFSQFGSSANYTTEKWHTALKLQKDRSLLVEEDISVSFKIPQHGIIRNIPYQYSLKGKPIRQIAFTLVSVSVDTGAGYQIVPCSQGFNQRDWVLKIGDKNKTISGPAKFRILYKATRVITDFDGNDPLGKHSELFWNAVGTSWATSIDKVSATITFPTPKTGKFAFRAVAGDLGQKKGVNLESVPSSKTDNNLTVRLEHAQNAAADLATVDVLGPLATGQGLTVAVALPEGTLDPQTAAEASASPIDRPATPTTIFDQTTVDLPSSPVGYFIPFFAIPTLYWFTRKRYVRFKGPLVTRFEPPENVGPSLCGYIVDHRVDPRDIVAGIVGLAQKGAARLRNLAAGQMQLELLGLDKGRGITQFDKELYGQLEPFGPIIDPAQLKGNFASSYGQLSRSLKVEAFDKHFFRGETTSQGCLWGCGFFTFLLAVSSVCLFFSPVGTAVGFVVSGIIAIVMLARMTNLLPEGVTAMGQVLGLKEFISRAQKDQLQSMVGKEPDQAMFEELLPYAVAFGMVDRWIKAFDGMNISQPDWFVTDGSDLYWTNAFLYSFDDFNSSYGDSISYSPPSVTDTSDEGSGFGGGSSGFDSGSFGGGDSGGSVGDGGGGGGGDSW